jgi:hypothetical protein
VSRLERGVLLLALARGGQKNAWPDAQGQTMERNQTALRTVILSAFSVGRISMGAVGNATDDKFQAVMSTSTAP